ncbi:MAG: LiaI-LiaF-like domain-containing protein [Terriglobia bacterium]
MKCANHPEAEVVAYCGHCGRALCAVCRRDVRGISYCENCLASRMQSSTFPPVFGSDLGPQPGLALFLGFIPGVGAIYNGQIMKAIIQVLIFGSLIALSGQAEGAFGTIFGLGAAAFYFYMVIDSYQTARRKQMGQTVEEWPGLGDLRMNAPISAIVLIALGLLFLLDNLGVPIFRDASRYWPVLLIVIGVILLQRRLNRPPRGPSNPGGPAGPGTGQTPGGQGSGSKEL